MMKKILMTAAAALTVLSAAAQDPGTTSTVKGGKLNFEAPLFDLSRKNVKPVWSVVAFGDLSYGADYAFHTPDEMKPLGRSFDITPIELRWRPGRGRNVLSMGLTYSFSSHHLKDGSVYTEKGSIAGKPADWLHATSSFRNGYRSLSFGYTREWNDWKVGVFVLPGVGYTALGNSYALGTAVPAGGGILYGDEGPEEGEDVVYLALNDNRHTESYSGNRGFRLGFKASITYRNIGISAGYNPKSIGSESFTGRYDLFSTGITLRF